MTQRYANQTTVPVERTRGEIEGILARYGADSFAYATEPGRAMIGFQITDTTGVRLLVRMNLPLPAKGEERFTKGWRGVKWQDAPDHAVQARWEQACRSTWRSLFLVIKAKLEACAAGISTIEREFLADVALPGGSTVGEWVGPQLTETYRTGGMPKLLPG